MRDTHISTVERNFTRATLRTAHRHDGRNPSQSRTPDITLSPGYAGNVEIRFNDTLAVASTTVEAIVPNQDRPNEGTLSISVNVSPTASVSAAQASLFRRTHMLEVRECVDRFIRQSRALDVEALCILAGVKTWYVKVDIDVLNDDGNAIDVCILAAMASLLHARRPEVSITGRQVRIHPMSEREPVPLPVHHVPLSVSYALFGDGGDTLFAQDPTAVEEASADGYVSFAYNAQGEVCGVYKAGGLPIDVHVFGTCAHMARRRVVELTEVLKGVLDRGTEVSSVPMAIVRPVMMKPEPVAEQKRFGESGKIEGAGGMWNARREIDELPPVVEEAAVGKGTVVVEDVFAKKEVARVDADVGKVEKEEIVREVVMAESGSESSDDDLASAVISRPRGGGGRSRKR